MMSKYKIGDKVVGEVCDTGYGYTFFDYGNSEPLSTYTEPLEAKIKRQAAEITRLLAENKELKEDFEKSKRVNLNMGRVAGQNEAWELARKIVCFEWNGGYTLKELLDIFQADSSPKILNEHTYHEAAAKVAQWEKAKEEIKVGDVYKSLSGNFVVCGIDREKDMAKALWDDLSVGKIYLYEIKEQYTKTGRHIDIDSFLNQIGGEE